MNSRLAEKCRKKYLDLVGSENSIYFYNKDTPNCLKCQNDIFLGFFFDGTNNNKYRDTSVFGHSNIARLYEAFSGWLTVRPIPLLQRVTALFLPPFLALFLLLGLSACQPSPAADETKAEVLPAGSVSVSVREANYNSDVGVDYTLFQLGKKEAVGGASTGPFEGGGQGCCMALPQTWRSDFKVRVDWNELDLASRKNNELGTGKVTRYSRTLSLPPYTKAGDVFVLFHPQHEVEVVVSNVEPGHPLWPGKVKQAPIEACLASQSKKFCYRFLRKYARGSPEELAAGFRNVCQQKTIQESNDIKGNQAVCDDMQLKCRGWEINKKMCELDYKDDEE